MQASLVADPPSLNPPIRTVGWFAQTELYVWSVQPICPVRQNSCNLLMNDAILKSFRTYNILKLCNKDYLGFAAIDYSIDNGVRRAAAGFD